MSRTGSSSLPLTNLARFAPYHATINLLSAEEIQKILPVSERQVCDEEFAVLDIAARSRNAHLLRANTQKGRASLRLSCMLLCPVACTAPRSFEKGRGPDILSRIDPIRCTLMHFVPICSPFFDAIAAFAASIEAKRTKPYLSQ